MTTEPRKARPRRSISLHPWGSFSLNAGVAARARARLSSSRARAAGGPAAAGNAARPHLTAEGLRQPLGDAAVLHGERRAPPGRRTRRDPQVHHRPPPPPRKATQHLGAAKRLLTPVRPVCCPLPVSARSSEALSPSTPGTLPAPLGSPTPRHSISEKAFPVSREATYRHPGRFPGVST